MSDFWPSLLPSPVASLRQLGEAGRHSFPHTLERTARSWRLLYPCLPRVLRQGPCCAVVLSYRSLME